MVRFFIARLRYVWRYKRIELFVLVNHLHALLTAVAAIVGVISFTSRTSVCPQSLGRSPDLLENKSTVLYSFMGGVLHQNYYTSSPSLMSSFAHLLPCAGQWKQTITAYLSEDVPSFDIGGFVVGDRLETASLYMKAPGIVCGIPFAQEVFDQCGLDVVWAISEGENINADALASANGKIVVATVSGPAHKILLAERTALNLMARASGIALALHNIVSVARLDGYTGLIAGTRKTTPGLRLVEKYAMVVGGADPHRYDLSAMVMLKDNHIMFHDSITSAVSLARKVAGFATKIEVEVATFEDACQAIEAGADVIMLDNFTGVELKEVAKSLKTKYKGTDHKFLLECLGGLTIDNLRGFVCNDIDIYSTSSIHQGTGIIDFSLKINERK